MAFGCPGHELRTKGLETCVDTRLPPGTVIEVSLVVVDSACRSSRVARTVSIAEPCDTPGETWCPQGSPSGSCSPLPCALLSELTDANNGGTPALPEGWLARGGFEGKGGRASAFRIPT